MLLREEDVQANANLRKVVQTESLGRGLYKSPTRGGQWYAPCDSMPTVNLRCNAKKHEIPFFHNGSSSGKHEVVQGIIRSITM